MYFIFFLACIVTGSFAEDSESNETKYIDLLPEHEKKAFLDKIARRIFEEVQAKGGNKETSGEISEAKLDAQNEYVAKLLKEESKSLRRAEKNKLEDKDTQSSDISKEKETKPNTNGIDKIDLTLRDSKRSKRNKSKETSEEEENKTNTTKTPENISVEIAIKNKNEPKSKEVKTKVKLDSGEKIPVKVVYDDTSTKMEDTTKEALRMLNKTSIETKKSNTKISEFSAEESKDSTSLDSIEPSKNESVTVENESTTAQNVTEKSVIKTGMTERIYEPIQSDDSSSDNEDKSQVDSNAKSSNESSSATKENESAIAQSVTEKSDIKTGTTERIYEPIQSDDSSSDNEDKSQVDSNAKSNNESSSATKENESAIAQSVTEKSDIKTGTTERIYEPIQSDDSSSDNENKSRLDSNAKLSDESSSAEKTQEDTTVTEPNVIQAETNATESFKDEIHNTTQVEQPNEKTPVLRTGKGNEARSVDNKDDNDPTRRNYEVLTTTFKTDSGETTSKDSEDNFETTSDSKVLENTKGKKESLRHGFFENSAETQIEDSKLFNDIQSRYNKDKVQHYEVYEISPDNVEPVVERERKLRPIDRNPPVQKDHPYYVPVYNYAPNKAYYRHNPDTGPFHEQERKLKPVGRNSPVQGNPHYIPVYNYAPNNAFFNPYNRLGPNFGDETRYGEPVIARKSQKQLRGRQKTKGAMKERLNNKVKLEFDFSKYVKPVKIKQQSFADYQFKDYYDMDFYFGRDGARKKQWLSKEYIYQEFKSEEKSNSIFPNSDESDHPRNKVPFKDQISAVRQILYKNKLFGYMPVQSTTTMPRNTKTTVNESDLDSNRSSTTEHPGHIEGKSRGYPAFGMYDWYNTLRSKYDSDDQSSREYMYQQNLKRPNNNPVSIDYYFGIDETKRSKLNQVIKNPKETYEEENKKIYLFGSSDPTDLLPTLDKLQSSKFKKTNDDLDYYFKVLKDMIDGNSRALIQYDWLKTTVDVRSALKKLSDLSQQIKSNAIIHPADMELFKYILYLHKTTRSSLRENYNVEDSLIPGVIFNRGLLPRNKHPGHRLITMKGKMNRVWLRKVPGNTEFRKDISDFDEFLNDLELGLDELHNAIKYIAMITKYNNQRWYINLKELYLSKATKKDLLGLLLHFSTSRLITLLEESSNNGLENGFFEYMAKNMDAVRHTKAEFLFVMRILDDFNEYY